MTFEVHANGTDTDPWGNQRVGLKVAGELSRGHYDMKFNQGARQRQHARWRQDQAHAGDLSRQAALGRRAWNDGTPRRSIVRLGRWPGASTWGMELIQRRRPAPGAPHPPKPRLRASGPSRSCEGRTIAQGLPAGGERHAGELEGRMIRHASHSIHEEPLQLVSGAPSPSSSSIWPSRRAVVAEGEKDSRPDTEVVP